MQAPQRERLALSYNEKPQSDAAEEATSDRMHERESARGTTIARRDGGDGQRHAALQGL